MVLPRLMVASNNMEQSVVEDLKVKLAEIARILKKKIHRIGEGFSFLFIAIILCDNFCVLGKS